MKQAHQGGQAMVEAAVMLGIVILLFLGIFYLGKFHDVQATAIQSARYAAWERTVHSASKYSDTLVQNQARARLFTWTQDSFKTTDGLGNRAEWPTQTSVWRDHAGRQRLIERPDDVLIATESGPVPGKAGEAIATGFNQVTKFLDGITGGEVLPKGGLVAGSVSVKLANIGALPAPLNKLDLTLNERSALMIDSWDASGPRQAALRSRTFTLAGPFTEIKTVLDPIRTVLSGFEPAFRDLHFGQVCPDIIPADRIEGASALPAYRGGGSCVH
jgi:hypothetical protein